jgi:oligopeptidase A
VNNIAWDAVELPSQFMENWVYDEKTVRSFARHHVTGEPLPAELFDKMKAARGFQPGRTLMHQLYLGALDLFLHSEAGSGRSFQPPLAATAGRRGQSAHMNATTATTPLPSCSAAEQFLLQPLHPDDRSLCTFSHIFAGGYAAGYYSYIWAEVMSADAFAAFEEAGLDNDAAVRATGARFRGTVLAQGGETAPAEVFRSFRGRDASPAALLRHRGLGD